MPQVKLKDKWVSENKYYPYPEWLKDIPKQQFIHKLDYFMLNFDESSETKIRFEVIDDFNIIQVEKEENKGDK